MAKERPQSKSAFKEATNEINLVKEMMESQYNITEIPLSLILSPKTHDRKCFDEQEIAELAQSIKTSGLLQPIVVRKIGTQFERLIGFKRITATKLLGNNSIKAIVLTNITDEQASLITISENLFRSDPNVYDQTLAFLDYASITLKLQSSDVVKLLNKYKAAKEIDEQEAQYIKVLDEIVSSNLAMKLRTLADRIKVLNINPLLIEAIQKRKIKYQEAILINKLDDEKKIEDLLKEIDGKDLSLNDIKKLLLKMQGSSEIEEDKYTKIFSKSLIKNINKLSDEKKKEIVNYLKKIESIILANKNDERVE